MSLSRDTMLELMALADGELEGEAKERAERVAAQSREAKRVVSAMQAPTLGLWLAEAVEQRSRLADGIADSVMARLNGSVVQAPERSDLELGKTAPRANAGLHRRQPGARPKSSSRVGIGIAGFAFAIAALVAMYVHSGTSNDDRATSLGSSNIGAPPRERETVNGRADGVHSGRGVEVEEIDSAMRISIFELSAIADTSTQSSVVVWIDDEPGQQ